VNNKKLNNKILFLSVIALILSIFTACSSTRIDQKAIKEIEQKTKIADDQFAKAYHKKYKHQTKIQSKSQKKMIKKGRKKPKTMKANDTFFLKRWFDGLFKKC
jgi:uncharacterized membrane protein (DUF106 family)